MIKKFVSFKDKTQPEGKRKVLYVKWLMQKKGLSLERAKLMCDRYFRSHG